jgi:predicted Zn-dependent protease
MILFSTFVRSRTARLLGAAAFCVAALAACDAPTVSRPAAAYSPTSLTNGQLYRWASGTTVRVWHIQPADSTRDVFRATQVALAEWNSVPQLREYRLESATSLERANIVIVDRTTPLPLSPASSCPFDARSSTGYTYFCVSGNRAQRLTTTNGAATDVSVIIRLDVAGMASQAVLESVVLHEMGHALGIGGHSSDTADVMFGNPTARFLSGRDVQTMQFLLGERPQFTL